MGEGAGTAGSGGERNESTTVDRFMGVVWYGEIGCLPMIWCFLVMSGIKYVSKLIFVTLESGRCIFYAWTDAAWAGGAEYVILKLHVFRMLCVQNTEIHGLSPPSPLFSRIC